VSAAELLERAVSAGVTPGAQACAIHRGRVVLHGAHGLLARGGGAVTESSRYDVASVTKVMATTAAAYVLISRGALELDERADRLVPAAPPVTVRDLLAHASGLPAWAPLFEVAAADRVAGAIFPGGPSAPRAAAFARSRELVREAALGQRPVHPPGSTRVYGDVGFMVLGEVIAAAAALPLDVFCEREVFAPLGLTSTGFVDLAEPPEPGAVACTGSTRPREPAPGQEELVTVPAQAALAVPGEVDDDNAYALAGVAGHAGVFSTSLDVARFGQAVLEELAGARRLGDPRVMGELCAVDPRPRGPARALGFDVPAPEGSQAGRRVGRGPLGAVGHLGFTGCSLWIDRDLELSIALLTNRVHLGRKDPGRIRELRISFHDAVVEGLQGERS
jgi:CubicO group peptidase (beta-lactamase class C family)